MNKVRMYDGPYEGLDEELVELNLMLAIRSCRRRRKCCTSKFR